MGTPIFTIIQLFSIKKACDKADENMTQFLQLGNTFNGNEE